MDLLGGLNPEQREAVTHLHGPLSVVAGAGSGKTRVITHRIANLIAHGVPAEAILGVTFTNRAAKEMQERVWVLTGGAGPTLATFHGFCARLLRIEAEAIGRRVDFTIYDASDALDLVKTLSKELSLDEDLASPWSLMDHLSSKRNARPDEPHTWSGKRWPTVDDDIARFEAAYDERLKTSNAFDFDSLLTESVRLLETRPDVLARWRARLTHVLVDEFQDTNWPQYRLVRLLTGTSGNLCVTGDPDQSIYTWRGADPRNFVDFKADHPGAKEVVLAQNYRSTNHILRCASAVMTPVSGRVPKNLWSDLGDGEPVRIVHFTDDRDEAQAVAQAVLEFEGDGFARDEIAIMFRVNALSLPVERALLERGVRYRVVGGPEFFGRQEVKDLLAYLRLLANPLDGQALLRIINVPARGLGDRTVDALASEARRQGRPIAEIIAARAWPTTLAKKATGSLDAFANLLDRLSDETEGAGPGATLEAVLTHTGYAAWWSGRASKGHSQDPLRNVGQFLAFAHEAEDSLKIDLRTFLEQTTLLGDRDGDDRDKVTLLTVHAAKGLEYNAVMLVGVEDDLIPHANARLSPGGLDEERRLLHVAMTRARRRLVLTVAGRRVRFGREQAALPSRFLRDLPSNDVETYGDVRPAWTLDEDEGETSGSRIVREASDDPDDPLLALRPGSTVRHPEYGTGTVIRIRSRHLGLDASAVVRFGDGAERTLILRWAKLMVIDAGGDDTSGDCDF